VLRLRRLSPAIDPKERTAILRDAKNLLDRSIELRKTDNALAFYYRALVMEGLGNIDAAIEDIGEAVRSEKNNVGYIFTWARLLEKRGGELDVRLAEDLYKSILSVNSQEIKTRFNLAILYKASRRYQEAMQELQTILELLPENAVQGRETVQEQIQEIESLSRSEVFENSQTEEGENLENDMAGDDRDR
jgi:tetratricopeptide (TPR) repeat protein